MRLAALALVALVAGAGPGWGEAPPKTISEALHRSGYTDSYNHMMVTGGPMQAWFVSAAAAMHSRDQSSTTVDVDGKPMQLFMFCEPRYCDSGSFAVMFDMIGKRAVGASDLHGAIQLFGGPTIFETDRLTSAFLP